MSESLFSQVHTDVKAVRSAKGPLNIPGETDRKDRTIHVSVYSKTNQRMGVGILDGDAVIDLDDSYQGLRGRVGIKSRITDEDGDGKVSLNELMDSATLDGFSYPEQPLIETVEV